MKTKRRSTPRTGIFHRARSNKCSTAAQRANVLTIQHYAGKPFVSYALHDKLKRESWFSWEGQEVLREVRKQIGVRL